MDISEDIEMTELEVIITNGVEQKRIIWISVTPNGVYCYFTMMGVAGDHISYHKDGSVWNSSNGVTRRGPQFQPFSSLKGSHQMVGMAFTTDLSQKLAVPQYEMKKLDSVVYIDVRPYIKKSADVGVNITLLEPNKPTPLEGMMPFAREIHLFTYVNPWLAITVYFSGPRERKQQ